VLRHLKSFQPQRARRRARDRRENQEPLRLEALKCEEDADLLIALRSGGELQPDQNTVPEFFFGRDQAPRLTHSSLLFFTTEL
jgi:hypothetical protein